jgi:hypothetical protein
MTCFLLLANFLVVGRLFSRASDQPRRWHHLLAIAALQSISAILIFKMPVCWLAAVAAIFVVCAILPGVLEPRCGDQADAKLILRLAILFAGLLVFGFLAGSHGEAMRQWVRDLDAEFVSHCAVGKPFARANWPVVLSRTLGMALCIMEAGTAVRLLMSVTGVKAPGGTEADFKHSALIGSVERLLVFIFVSNVQYNAVAFILTAKGVVRLHETAKGQAAEYVLVGTLYSTLVAISITLAVSKLM